MPPPPSPGAGRPQHALDRLAADHELIRSLLDAVDAEAAHTRACGELRDDTWRDVCQCLRSFVARVHQEIEERLLFPALRAAGIDGDDALITSMLAEHRDAVAITAELDDALRAGEVDGVARLAGACTEHFRAHIAREDGELFAVARTALSAAVSTELIAGFARCEQELIGADGRNRYERLVRSIRVRVGLGDPEFPPSDDSRSP